MDTKTIGIAEITQYIELNKKKAELEFKYAIIHEKNKSENKTEIEKELAVIHNKIASIQAKLTENQIPIVMPYQEEIEILTERLKNVNHTMILTALQAKKGAVYELLTLRGTILKNNFEKRTDIAKLLLLMNSFSTNMKTDVYTAIKKGKITGEIGCSEDESKKKLLMKLFWRIGIVSYVDGNSITAQKTEHNQEEEMQIVLQDNKKVWITQSKQTILYEVEEKLKRISAKIQLKNAERQVKVFDESEEKEFSDIQNEYLRLLKDRDAVLNEFYNEEVVVKAFATYGPSG